jgi:hypothetical protein
MRRFISNALAPRQPSGTWPRHSPAPAPTAARLPTSYKEGRPPALARRGAPRGADKGVLKSLDPVTAGVARELSQLTKPADVLAHHAEAMDDYDAVAAAAALGKVAAAGLGGSAGVAPWKRQPLPVREVDALARHTAELLREELRGGGGRAPEGQPQLPVRALASGLHALAKVGRAPASLLHEASYSLVNAVEAARGGGGGGGAVLAPADVSQLAFAFSRSNVRAPQLFNALADAATGAGLRGYRPSDMAGLLLSFAALRTPAPALFAAGAEAVCARREQAESVTPQVIANAVMALAKAGGQDEGAGGATERARAARRRAAAEAAAAGAPGAPPGAQPPPPPLPPPSQGATAARALEALAPRVETIARRFRVPGVQAGAFTAQGAAMVLWAYARVLRRQEAWGVAAGAAGALRAASAAAAAGAVGAAFCHPQTLATATPPQLAMVAQAFAELHEACAGAPALRTGAVVAAVARAAARLLDPAASGREMAARAAVAGEAVRRRGGGGGEGGSAGGGGGGGGGGGDGAALSLSARAGGVGGGEKGWGEEEMEAEGDAAEAAAAREDWLAVERMVEAAVAGGGRGRGRGRGGSGDGDGDADVAVPANPSAPLRYSPLAYSKSLALATPFSLFDVAQLADALARVGHTAHGAAGCAGGAETEECWVKLSERVARGVAGRGSGGGGSSARAAARALREDAIRDLAPSAAATLAAAFAFGAPRAPAARALTALALAFCEEDEGAKAWVGAGGAAGAPLPLAGDGSGGGGRGAAASEDSGGGGGGGGDALSALSAAAAVARSQGWRLREAPPSPAGRGGDGDVLPSFDEDPDWLGPAAEAVRRSATFRRAPAHPVHRLRGEPAEGGGSALLEIGARGAAEEEEAPGGLLPGEEARVAAGTGRSWAARLLHRLEPPALARLAVALAIAFPAEGAAAPPAGGGGEGDGGGAADAGVAAAWARAALARAAPPAWALPGGPLAADAEPPARLLRGLLPPPGAPAPPLARAALAHTLAAVCARLAGVWEGSGGVRAASELLPLLSSRRYRPVPPAAGGGGGGGGAGGPAWPPEALARATARALLAPAAPAGGRRPHPLPLPLSAYAALAPALGAVVSNALRAVTPRSAAAGAARAQPRHRVSLAAALASAAPARAALGALAGAAEARYAAPGRDAGRAAASHALGAAVAAALLPAAAWAASARGAAALGGEARGAEAAAALLGGADVAAFARRVASEEAARRGAAAAAAAAAARVRGGEWAAIDAATGEAALRLAACFAPPQPADARAS